MLRVIVAACLASIVVATPHTPALAAPGPQLALTIVPESPAQGDVIIVRAQTSAATAADSMVGTLGQQTLRFVRDNAGKGPGLIALSGIDPLRPAGDYPIAVSATLNSGALISTVTWITVRDAGFITESVAITKALANTLDPVVSADEEALVRAVYAQFTPEQQWRGPFRPPLKGKILSGYGNHRIYNGADLGTYHAGIDFYGLKGRPVTAAAAGTVVLVKRLVVRGNMIVIDHGRGVFTSYAHLSKTLVKPGDAVAAGRKIGEVGSTGRSQGNHLHFEIAVGGVSIEPSYWLSRTLP